VLVPGAVAAGRRRACAARERGSMRGSREGGARLTRSRGREGVASAAVGGEGGGS
jgi:hypothetical protein